MKLIKIPYSAGCMRKNLGTELAPDFIANELKNFYVNENRKNINFNIDKVDIDNSQMMECHKRIFEKIKNLKEKAIIVGGDHSITYSAARALGDCCLIIFDAHADLMPSNDFVSHEDWLRRLIDHEGFNKKNIFLVGIRDLDVEEYDFLEKNKIKKFTMKEVYEYSAKEVCETIMEFANKYEQCYISIDIDVADPAFAPGTGCIAPGGLSSRELVYFIQRLKNLKNIRIMDFVEINPKKDINDLTIKLGAKLVSESL